MTSISHSKCGCRHCGGHIEFPTDAAGLAVECPHCGQQTQLTAPAPRPSDPGAGIKILFTGLAVLVLAAAIAGTFFLHRRAERQVQLQKEWEAAAKAAAAAEEAKASDPLAQAGWKVSGLRLEKEAGRSVTHATGNLKNETDHRRFGVKVQLDIFDADDNKIGGATDYSQAVDAHADWQFKALVLNSKAVSAKVVSVEESP